MCREGWHRLLTSREEGVQFDVRTQRHFCLIDCIFYRLDFDGMASIMYPYIILLHNIQSSSTVYRTKQQRSRKLETDLKNSNKDGFVELDTSMER
jgi:hypothetical protein